MDNDKRNTIFRFTNYAPQTHFLDGLYSLERAQPDSIDHLIKDKLDLTIDSEDNDNKCKIDPKLLEPKKTDWDLKHRIERRMEKLERETRKSIDRHIKGMRTKTK